MEASIYGNALHSVHPGALPGSNYAQSNVAPNPLVPAAEASRYIGDDQREYTGAVSHVSGVVPTGLFTSYVPAAHIAGHARQAAYASAQDFARIHESRMAEVTERAVDAQPLTVYYTDDLYPPYYSKAKKVRSQKRGKPGCCE